MMMKIILFYYILFTDTALLSVILLLTLS